MAQEDTSDIKPATKGPFHGNVVPEQWLRRRLVGRYMFSTEQVAAMLGLHMRTFRHWLAKKLVAPDIDPGGRGSRRLFSVPNLVEVALLDVLWRAGTGAERARVVLDALRQDGYFDRLCVPGRKAADEPVGIMLKDGVLVGLCREIRVDELLNCSQSTTWIHLLRVEQRVADALERHQA